MPSQISEPKATLVGQSIDHGRYELLRVIGEGGMGKVYEARQKRVDRLVAVKVLHSHWAKDPKLVARFKREALTASQFRHPNTVMIYDYGETESGDLYIIMELLKGQSLLSLLDREGPLSIERAVKIVEQICGAVAEVHRCGVIHRDLKPENIQIDPRDGHPDFVKLLDFSIAKLMNDNILSSTETNQNLTLQGAVFGTPQYMSPEQVRGRSLDHRTDLYAIGVIFYQMLTGFVPFSESTPQGTMMAHLTEPVPLFEDRVPHLDIHPAAAQIVYDCLEKNPDDRITSSEALTRRIFDLKLTLQREEEARAELDTDMGTPQVTSRLTSASSSETSPDRPRDPQVTDETSSPPTMSSASEAHGTPGDHNEKGDEESQKTDESLPSISLNQGLKPRGFTSQLKLPPLSESPLQQKLKGSFASAQKTSDEDETSSSDALVKPSQQSTGETQEFNPELHGEELVGGSITSALTIGVEELAHQEKGQAKALHQRQSISIKREGESPTSQEGVSESQEAEALTDSLIEEEALSDSLIEEEAQSEALNEEEAQSEALNEDESSTGDLPNKDQHQAPIGTQEFHAQALSKDQSDVTLNHATQELNRVTGSNRGTPPLKETLPLYGFSKENIDYDFERNDRAPAVEVNESDVQKTGVFEASVPKRHVGLSVALVASIALIVFITLNPQLIRTLLNRPKVTHQSPAKITLGVSAGEIRYRLKSTPVGVIFDRQSGEVIGETPFEWTTLDQRLKSGALSVKSEGYKPQIIVASGFLLSADDPKLKELHVQLKLGTTLEQTKSENASQPNEALQQDLRSSTLSSEGTKTVPKPILEDDSTKDIKPKKDKTNRRKNRRNKNRKKTPKKRTNLPSVTPKKVNLDSGNQQEDRSQVSAPKPIPADKKAQEKVPELPTLSPDQPLDPVRFQDSLEVDKLP